MNNPGINAAIWERLKAKWTRFDASEESLRVDFKLITADTEKDKTLAIDVVQTIDDEVYVETVQRNPGEAYRTLGIVGYSIEKLVQTYKKCCMNCIAVSTRRRMSIWLYL